MYRIILCSSKYLVFIVVLFFLTKMAAYISPKISNFAPDLVRLWLSKVSA